MAYGSNGRDTQRSKVYRWDGVVNELVSRKRWEKTLESRSLTVNEVRALFERDDMPGSVTQGDIVALMKRSQSSAHLTLEKVGALVRKVADDYGIPVPRIKDGRGTRIAHGDSAVLNLPRWARTTETVLHEMAHCVTARKLGEGIAPHGPEFARLLAELYTRYMKISLSEALRLGRESGVKFASASQVPKPLDREERRLIKEYELAKLAVTAAMRAEKSAWNALQTYRQSKRLDLS